MLSHRPRVAVIQLCSTPERDANLVLAEQLVRQAAAQGAELVCLPENAPWMGPDKARDAFCEDADGPSLHLFRSLASSLDVNILLGSYAERIPDQTRGANTSALIARDGQVVASYRKLHLFDVTTPNGESLRESDTVFPGDAPVCAALGPWTLGLSICYDLRFPELYRRLVELGATALCVPAAFTAETGRDHWTTLLRARAIENQCYVIAPNQFGRHFGERRCYGRSAIIDPWGTVLAQVPDGVGVACAELELDKVLNLRQRFPCLQHRRL